MSSDPEFRKQHKSKKEDDEDEGNEREEEEKTGSKYDYLNICYVLQ
jgi:hypothetical protein